MRLVPALLVSVLIAAGCESARQTDRVERGPKTVHVQWGDHKVFEPGELRKGDLVVCGHERSAGARVGPPGTVVANSAGLNLERHADGSVEVDCAAQGPYPM